MSRSTLRTGVALLAVLSMGGCKTLDDVMASLTPNRSMRNSISFDPYENPMPPDPTSVSFASGNFPSARGVINLGEPEPSNVDLPDFDKADMANAATAIANSLVNPVPADAASLARGEELYNRFCAVCHGPNGQSAQASIAPAPGLGPYMLAWNLALPGANAFNYSDGYIYGMIRVGRNIMPSYGHRITHYDRWNVVNYVRELQRRALEGN